VHSFVLDGCGLTDEMFSVMLEGMIHLSRLKSIIYRRSELGERSAIIISSVITRFPPDNLDEVRIERCNVNQNGLKYLLK
jgi:hypothetical protein